jgi:hypothetical protein
MDSFPFFTVTTATDPANGRRLFGADLAPARYNISSVGSSAYFARRKRSETENAAHR